MTREIKFRAWSKVRKRIENVEAIFFGKDRDGDYMTCNTNYGMEVSISLSRDSFMLMQFTGLKDKNDNEIYEGDLVEVYDELDEKFRKIIFKDGGFLFFVERGKMYNQKELTEKHIEKYKIEVIGNIYENKDLLS